MPGAILTYYQKHRNLIEKYSQDCKNPEALETIHDLRLSIKRIKAVAKLTDHLSNQAFDSKNTLYHLLVFFKSSGKLRDIQVIKQLLLNYSNDDMDSIIHHFSQREVKQRAKFDRALTNFQLDTLDDIEIRLSKELAKYPEKVALAAGRRLMSIYISEIHNLFNTSSEEKRLHIVRTRLKDINYLNNIFDKQFEIKDHIHISVERLRELGELAGKWHDHLNLETSLEKYLQKDPKAKNVEAIIALTINLRVRKEGLAQEYSCVLMNEMKV